MLNEYMIERWPHPYPPNPAMLRYELVREGYTVFQWCDGPGKSYGGHSHPEEQSHWIVSGSMEITIENGGRFVLEAGDRDFVPANERHSAKVAGEHSVLYLIGARIECK